MCEPTTLSVASLALVAAGTAATAYGVQQADKAEGAATQAELARQKKLRDEADRGLGQTIAANSAAKTKKGMEENASERASVYDQSARDAAAYAPAGLNLNAGGDGMNRVVADAYRARLGGSSDFVRQQGAARAALQSLDDQLLENAIFNQNQGYELQKLGSFMGGSAAVLPYELRSAANEGKGARTLGGILSALGSVTGAGTATGAIGGAAAAAGQASSAGRSASDTRVYTRTNSRPIR